MSTEEFEDAKVCCGTCKFFQPLLRQRAVPGNRPGMCLRYPQPVEKADEDVCGEHKFVEPDDKILATDLIMLPMITSRTRAILKNLGLVTIGDVCTVGRGHIVFKGKPDRRAIAEVERAMLKLGVEW